MNVVRFLADFGLACGESFLWRRYFGPERRGWTLPQEAFVRVLRKHAHEMIEMRPEVVRATTDALQQTLPPRRDVRARECELGGVPGMELSPLHPAVEGPTILYFHGGAYVFGSSRSYAAHLSALAAATGGKVFAPDYRLAPEHRFPAAVQDAARAVDALLEREDPSRVVVAGDSAGGALAIAGLFHRRDRGEPMPAGIVTSSPWIDLSIHIVDGPEAPKEAWIHSSFLRHFGELYLGGVDPADPRASPLRGDLTGLPPIRAQVGSAELICKQLTDFTAKARVAGVDAKVSIWPDMVHGWWAMPFVFPAHQAVRELARWVHELAGEHRARPETSASRSFRA